MNSPVPTTSLDIFPESIRYAINEIDRNIGIGAFSCSTIRRDEKTGKVKVYEGANFKVMQNLLTKRFISLGFSEKFYSGMYRMTFVHKTEPWVVKITKNRKPRDLMENIIESYMYSNIEAKYRKYLPETYLWNNGILIQRRYLPNLSHYNNLDGDTQRKIRDKAEALGVGDAHANNIGWTEDKTSYRFIDFQPVFGGHSGTPLGALRVKFYNEFPEYNNL